MTWTRISLLIAICLMEKIIVLISPAHCGTATHTYSEAWGIVLPIAVLLPADNSPMYISTIFRTLLQHHQRNRRLLFYVQDFVVVLCPAPVALQTSPSKNPVLSARHRTFQEAVLEEEHIHWSCSSRRHRADHQSSPAPRRLVGDIRPSTGCSWEVRCILAGGSGCHSQPVVRTGAVVFDSLDCIVPAHRMVSRLSSRYRRRACGRPCDDDESLCS